MTQSKSFTWTEKAWPAARCQKRTNVKAHTSLAFCLAMLAAACDNGSSTPVLTPATISTEMFTGTVAVQGSDFHNFTVAQNGQVDVTLTTAGPPSSIFMGLGIGVPSGTTCSLLTNASVSTQAGATAQLSGTAAAATYCVVVFDVGNQSAPVDYAVTVAHP